MCEPFQADYGAAVGPQINCDDIWQQYNDPLRAIY